MENQKKILEYGSSLGQNVRVIFDQEKDLMSIETLCFPERELLFSEWFNVIKNAVGIIQPTEKPSDRYSFSYSPPQESRGKYSHAIICRDSLTNRVFIILKISTNGRSQQRFATKMVLLMSLIHWLEENFTKGDGDFKQQISLLMKDEVPFKLLQKNL